MFQKVLITPRWLYLFDALPGDTEAEEVYKCSAK